MALLLFQFLAKKYIPGLEKSSVLPVLDRFLSLKPDFVLNRKQKNRSIKVRFFSVQFSMTVYNSYLSRQFTVNFTPLEYAILFNPFVHTCIT